MFRNPALRHKTVPRICLNETFSPPFCHYLHIFTDRAPFADVLTLPVRLRPPEMGIVVVIGVVCRYWEGGFVCGG